MATTPSRSESPGAHPSPHAGRWTATAILSTGFALSYIDRQVLSLLVPSIKAALGLSDTQIGLLQGISFSLFYVAASLPLAALADRRNRARIAAACIGIWSVMTMLCGLASGFVQLLLARIGLAMAEAGLPPSALTLMNDLHDRKGLARATSFFMLAPFVGGGIALAGGGILLESVQGMASVTGLSPWRLVFIFAGVPGILLAPLVWSFLRDPRRIATEREGHASFRMLGSYMAANWRFTVIYMLALAIVIMVLNAHIAWMPTAILRRFPVGEALMGTAFGAAYLLAGSIGTLGSGWIISRGDPATMLRRTISLMQWGSVFLIPFAVAAPFAPDLVAMIALTSLAVLFTSGIIAMGSIPFQISVPHQLRAQSIALSGLVAALIGTGLGPLVTGFASDAAARAGADLPLSSALAAVGGTCAAVAALMMRYVLRHASAQQSISAPSEGTCREDEP